MVFLFDIIAKVPTTAAGKAHSLPEGPPEARPRRRSTSPASSRRPATSAKQTKASAHVVIEGNGPKVKLGQTLSVHYLGQIYPAGKVFDSSWARGAPSPFQLAEGR